MVKMRWQMMLGCAALLAGLVENAEVLSYKEALALAQQVF
jgi:hypothetical protein